MQPEVSHLCLKAAAAASEALPQVPDQTLAMAEVELTASLMGTRAFLTQNKDAEAFKMAQQSVEIARKSFSSTGAEGKKWQGAVLSNSNAALVQHAAGDFETAAESFDLVVGMMNDDSASTPLKQESKDAMISTALTQAAAFRNAQRRETEALLLAARAADGAEHALEDAVSSVSPLVSPVATREALIGARLQQAQACIGLKQWEDAEEHLSACLEIAEELGSGSKSSSHVRFAFVLIPLARVYARTRRATLAEGLYREVAKYLRLAPSSSDRVVSGGSGALDLMEVHASVAALAAWQYSQLLTVLPRRETEADLWRGLAEELYDDAPLRMVLEPATVFGSLDTLQGKGTDGYGVVLDLMTRRALPRAPPPLPAV